MSDLLRLSLPLTVWLAAFSGLYGLQGLLCAMGPAADARPALIAAACAALAVQVALALLLASPRFASPRPFVHRVGVAIGVVGVAAAAWSFLPVLVTSACV